MPDSAAERTDAVKRADASVPASADLIRELFIRRGLGPCGIRHAAAGQNSRLFKVTDGGGRLFAVKTYPQFPGDARERLKNEFRSLELLWSHKFRSVPKPYFADPKANSAVFEYVRADGSAWGKYVSITSSKRCVSSAPSKD